MELKSPGIQTLSKISQSVTTEQLLLQIYVDRKQVPALYLLEEGILAPTLTFISDTQWLAQL